MSSEAQAWHDAMLEQTAHEAGCSPCRHSPTPVCDEGKRLQHNARLAHQEYVAGRYVPLAMAS